MLTRSKKRRLEFFLYSSNKSVPKDVINVRVDSTVRLIEQRAFSQCTQLTNVEINEGPEEIRESAFADCKSLVRIIIPSSVNFIFRRAFISCTLLMNVELPKGIMMIAEGTFMSCKSLKEITLPASARHCQKLQSQIQSK